MTAAIHPSRLAYQPQLDGLRGIAVLLVFLYHADVPLLERGGYIGVDIFFVLSGYLITTLILREHDATGGIALRQFYVRRVRRLAPALILVASGVAVAYLVIPWAPVPRDTILGSLASLGQVAAWPRAVGATQLGYMGHAWSLSVEEHFYLVWPALMAIVLWRRPQQARWVLLGLALAGIAYGNIAPVAFDWSFDRAYNSPDLRASDILVGCVLALALHGATRMRGVEGLARFGGAASAVVLLAWSATTRHQDTLYLTWSLIVVVAAAIVVLHLVWLPGSGLSRLLSKPALVWVGLRSYGIYLIHHPVIGLLRPAGTVGIVVLGAASTAVAAEISYRFLEVPIRRHGLVALRHLGRRPADATAGSRPAR